jgi:hypothetical protein
MYYSHHRNEPTLPRGLNWSLACPFGQYCSTELNYLEEGHTLLKQAGATADIFDTSFKVGINKKTGCNFSGASAEYFMLRKNNASSPAG